MTISEMGDDTVDLGEAARQLERAAHDAQVAYDSIGLGNLDRAHTYAIMARAAADSRRAGNRVVAGNSTVRVVTARSGTF